MELKETDIEALESYKMGLMTEGERLALEKRLADDAIFKQQAQEYWTLMSALSTAGELKTRDYLKNINKGLPPVPPPPSSPFMRYMIAALALALAAFAVWFFKFKKEEEPAISRPIAAVFEPYPALGITMGDDDKTVRLEALLTYAKKNYKQAIPLLDIAFETEKDSLLLFYKGIAHIGIGESNRAIPIFESLQTTTILPIESVEWYLALAYLETNQKDKALILLEKIKNTEGGKYGEKAKALISKFNQ